jgi:hypothetical protein
MRNFISETAARTWMETEAPVSQPVRKVIVGYLDDPASMEAYDAARKAMGANVYEVLATRIVTDGKERRANLAGEHD